MLTIKILINKPKKKVLVLVRVQTSVFYTMYLDVKYKINDNKSQGQG